MKYLKSFESFYNNNNTELYCSGEDLISLPTLPEYLLILKCFNNKIKKLPEELPIKLEILYCSNNNLTTLPELPNTLKELFCNGNKLKKLPELPNSLIELCCCDNDWIEPIKYQYMIKFNLKMHNLSNNHKNGIYTYTQATTFRSYNFQKEFFENNPSRYEDLIPFGYADGIKELFPHIFSAHELGL